MQHWSRHPRDPQPELGNGSRPGGGRRVHYRGAKDRSRAQSHRRRPAFACARASIRNISDCHCREAPPTPRCRRPTSKPTCGSCIPIPRSKTSCGSRSRADLRRLQALVDGGLMDRVAASLGMSAASLKSPEHYREMAVAYVANLNGVRSHLSAAKLSTRSCGSRRSVHLPGTGGKFRPRLYRIFKRYCREFPIADPATRQAAWRAIARNHWGSAEALIAWHAHGENARTKGEQILAEIVRHPGRLTEQIVTLRTVRSPLGHRCAELSTARVDIGKLHRAGSPSERSARMGHTARITIDAPPHPTPSRINREIPLRCIRR